MAAQRPCPSGSRSVCLARSTGRQCMSCNGRMSRRRHSRRWHRSCTAGASGRAQERLCKVATCRCTWQSQPSPARRAQRNPPPALPSCRGDASASEQQPGCSPLRHYCLTQPCPCLPPNQFRARSTRWRRARPRAWCIDRCAAPGRRRQRRWWAPPALRCCWLAAGSSTPASERSDLRRSQPTVLCSCLPGSGLAVDAARPGTRLAGPDPSKSPALLSPPSNECAWFDLCSLPISVHGLH